MKKITNLFEQFADHQLGDKEAKSIKGGQQGIKNPGGDPPPF